MSLYQHAIGQKMNVIESKIAGLGFLQAIIARMANNSFYIKGWDLTLFVALHKQNQIDSLKNFNLISLQQSDYYRFHPQ